MRGIAAIGGILLAMSALPAAAATPAPNPATCPRPKGGADSERQRKHALPVPATLRGLVGSDLVHFAVATLAGGTVCVDTGWMETADNLALSADGRFLQFGWHGNESFGHVVVDRTGRGQVVDTGVTPVFSPSHGKLAAIDMSESGFGALDAFAVWRIDAVGLHQLAKIDDLPSQADWRIDRWVGETCIQLSALPLDVGERAKAPRLRFAARPKGSGWAVTAGACPSA
jgi:hypothetical protein